MLSNGITNGKINTIMIEPSHNVIKLSLCRIAFN